MSDLKPQPAPRPDAREKPLPLVIEIMSGQAAEGLLEIFEPGTYEGRSLRVLCKESLARTNRTIEERQILEDINRQLDGGKLLARGREIDEAARDYAVVEETEEGEKYLYVAIRAIKPQEGGRPGR